MKNFIFGLILCTSSFFCAAQAKLDIRQVYYGGICLDKAICGYWILRHDSTFIFFNFSGKSIHHAGKGTYQLLKNKRIRFTFQPMHPPIPAKSIVEYASGKQPGDSVFITGKVESEDSTSSSAIVVVSDGHNTILRKDGTFSMSFPRKKPLSWMIIANRFQGFPSIEIPLDTAATFHKVSIRWKANDSTDASPSFHPVPFFGAPVSSPSLELGLAGRDDKIKSLTIKPAGQSVEEFQSKLEDALSLQPHLRNFVESLLEEKK